MNRNKKNTTGDESIQTLHVKNMVCDRCIRVVREELEKLQFDVRSIKLGEVAVSPGKKSPDLTKVRTMLQVNGFDLIDDKRVRLVEKVKNAVIKLIHYRDEDGKQRENTSAYLEREVGMEYHYLSSLFSSMEGITIEQYLINQKIEKVKELIKYDELTLSEIAYRLGYSSVAHLSNQFKKVTGLTATEFKSMSDQERKPLDKV